VLIIGRSPAVTGVQPANGGDKRIFFWQSAIPTHKKDFYSISWHVRATIYRFLHRSENQNTRPLAESAACCSYPVN
jgi:hypothetical protein